MVLGLTAPEAEPGAPPPGAGLSPARTSVEPESPPMPNTPFLSTPSCPNRPGLVAAATRPRQDDALGNGAKTVLFRD